MMAGVLSDETPRAFCELRIQTIDTPITFSAKIGFSRGSPWCRDTTRVKTPSRIH